MGYHSVARRTTAAGAAPHPSGAASSLLGIALSQRNLYGEIKVGLDRIQLFLDCPAIRRTASPLAGPA